MALIDVPVNAIGQTMGLRRMAPPQALDGLGVRRTSLVQQAGKRDIYFGGVGVITGTVKEKNLPVNVPLHRRVCLLEEKTRLVVAETWSDAVTGNYTFANIDPTRTYTVLAYDHTGLYRAVIADNIIPDQL